MSLLSGEKLAGGGVLQSFFTQTTDTRERKWPPFFRWTSPSLQGMVTRVHGGAKWEDGMNRSRAAEQTRAGAILWMVFFFSFFFK